MMKKNTKEKQPANPPADNGFFLISPSTPHLDSAAMTFVSDRDEARGSMAAAAFFDLNGKPSEESRAVIRTIRQGHRLQYAILADVAGTLLDPLSPGFQLAKLFATDALSRPYYSWQEVGQEVYEAAHRYFTNPKPNHRSAYHRAIQHAG